jgi:hypothetical protein
LLEIIIPPKNKNGKKQVLREIVDEYDEYATTRYYVVKSEYSDQNFEFFEYLYLRDMDIDKSIVIIQ